MKRLELKLTIMDVKEPDLLDFTSLLYDIELLHDLYVFSLSGKYKDKIDFDKFYTRIGRPIKSEDRLKLISLKKESPFEIVLLVASFEVLVILFLMGLKEAFNLVDKTLDVKVKWWDSKKKMYEAKLKKREYLKTKQGEKVKQTEAWLIDRLRENDLRVENIRMKERKSDDHTFK